MDQGRVYKIPLLFEELWSYKQSIDTECLTRPLVGCSCPQGQHPPIFILPKPIGLCRGKRHDFEEET